MKTKTSNRLYAGALVALAGISSLAGFELGYNLRPTFEKRFQDSEKRCEDLEEKLTETIHETDPIAQYTPSFQNFLILTKDLWNASDKEKQEYWNGLHKYEQSVVCMAYSTDFYKLKYSFNKSQRKDLTKGTNEDYKALPWADPENPSERDIYAKEALRLLRTAPIRVL